MSKHQIIVNKLIIAFLIALTIILITAEAVSKTQQIDNGGFVEVPNSSGSCTILSETWTNSNASQTLYVGENTTTYTYVRAFNQTTTVTC